MMHTKIGINWTNGRKSSKK